MTETQYIAVRRRVGTLAAIDGDGRGVPILLSREEARERVADCPSGTAQEVYGCIPVGELELLEDRVRELEPEGRLGIVYQLRARLDAAEQRAADAERRAADAGLAAGAKFAEQFGVLEEIRDPEIDAMAAIAQALEPLDEAQRRRALSWAQDRFARGAAMRLSVTGGMPSPTITPTPIQWNAAL